MTDKPDGGPAPALMTPDEIAAMQADALAGTPGDWVADKTIVHIGRCGDVKDNGKPNWGGFEMYRTPNAIEDARRIARVPRMEATIIAHTAEITRLENLAWANGRAALLTEQEEARLTSLLWASRGTE